MIAQQKAAGLHANSRAGQRRQAAGRRGEDRRPALPRWCCSPAPARPNPPPTIWSPSTTPAGPPTEKCSTARSRATRQARFPLDRVIKGWGEGVQLMVVGEKRRFWIPQEIAYNGMAGRPAGMLVFDIELLDVSPNPSTPPPDVAAPPADAKRTASGSRLQVTARGQRWRAAHSEERGDRALHGLDDGRKDVRHLRR